MNLDEVDVDACVAAIEDGGEHIWGIAANFMAKSCGDNAPREIMSRTLAGPLSLRLTSLGLRFSPL